MENGDVLTRLLILQLVSVLEYQTWFRINAETHTIDKNMRNWIKKTAKLSGYIYKITNIFALNCPTIAEQIGTSII